MNTEILTSKISEIEQDNLDKTKLIDGLKENIKMNNKLLKIYREGLDKLKDAKQNTTTPPVQDSETK
ncbi:MAG TPA: hypothetical protein VD927_06715 [Chryseosolibacter sp.]|nr:hypothetical protein [Chryseosolibacter sp.]